MAIEDTQYLEERTGAAPAYRGPARKDAASHRTPRIPRGSGREMFAMRWTPPHPLIGIECQTGDVSHQSGATRNPRWGVKAALDALPTADHSRRIAPAIWSSALWALGVRPRKLRKGWIIPSYRVSVTATPSSCMRLA
jgi:hypothetical protein